MILRGRAPLGIGILMLTALLLPRAAARDGGDSPDLRSRLREYLLRMADSGFAFSALVAIDNDVVLSDGYGRPDPSRGEKATDRTLFNIASITKSFTAITVLSLAERGLLSPGDSLPKFFRDIPGDKRGITLSELLSHASGLAQHYAADGISGRDSAVASILGDPLAFPPGSGFSYSNENYELLGAVIEEVTGRNYEDVVREAILSRAGMADTRFWSDPAGPGDVRIASKTRELDSATLARNWGYIASGGIWSNVRDLYRWFESLAGGNLIRPETLDSMLAVRRKLEQTSVAYGWFLSDAPWGREIWTRGNEDWGHNAVLRWFPDRRTVIIVMSNSGERGDKNISANRFISDELARIIFQ